MGSRFKPTIRQRVENGCKWLDENFPGWEERVDLETLALENGYKCICGQVFEDDYSTPNPYRQDEVLENRGGSGFLYATKLLQDANSWITSLVGKGPGRSRHQALLVAHYLGFFTDDPSLPRPQPTYDQLDREWRRVLKARKKVREAPMS